MVRNADDKFRVYIPKSFANILGINLGDYLFWYEDSNGIFVSPIEMRGKKLIFPTIRLKNSFRIQLKKDLINYWSKKWEIQYPFKVVFYSIDGKLYLEPACD